MFGKVEDQPKKTKKESRRYHLSLEYEGVLTSSRSSRRSLKSSVADDLSLEDEDFLTSSGAEDLSSLQQSMLEEFFQTHYTCLTKYIVISCIDVDLIWRSDKVSFVYYTILRKGLYHPLYRSTLQAKTPQDKRYILYLAEDLCPSFAQQVSHAFNA
ncbi:hypothetical protein L6452_40586 [Arctium lappa]|uniref:Uncharacterized protein n=1 Tax=Arctium lappa TaxID=4217 RepID=A0ACB8XLS7_ARCLA|nr:hypothetical protein L6452_40586 [Arctium lappa]